MTTYTFTLPCPSLFTTTNIDDLLALQAALFESERFLLILPRTLHYITLCAAVWEGRAEIQLIAHTSDAKKTDPFLIHTIDSNHPLWRHKLQLNKDKSACLLDNSTTMRFDVLERYLLIPRQLADFLEECNSGSKSFLLLNFSHIELTSPPTTWAINH